MAVPGDLVVLAPQRSTRSVIVWRSRFPDSGVFGFRLAWNTRGFFWALDMRISAGSELMRGIPVRTGRLDIIGPMRDTGWPLGQLFCEDVEGLGRDPARDGWRTINRLVYRPAALVETVAGTDDEVF